MKNAEEINLIIAIGAAIATGLSALAAFRSAASAEAARRALDEDQLRNGRREVANLVSSCAYEHARVKSLAQTLSAMSSANAIFAGGYGGSRQKEVALGINKRLDQAAKLFHASAAFNDNPRGIGELAVEDVERLQVSLPIHLSALRAIAEELAREHASSEAQLLQHRERLIANRPA